MPWRVAKNPKIDYSKRMVKVGSGNPQLESTRWNGAELVWVANLSAKKLKRLLRNRGGISFTLYKWMQWQVHQNPKQRKSCWVFLTRSETESCKSTIKCFKNNSLLDYRKNGLLIMKLRLAKKPPIIRFVSCHRLSWKRPLMFRICFAKGNSSKRVSVRRFSLLCQGKRQAAKKCFVDYRALIDITKRNISPLPRSHEMFDMLGEARIFSKLDLKSGFHQTRVRPADIEKTALNTKYGQFEQLVMPMGLCHSSATFRTLINRIF